MPDPLEIRIRIPDNLGLTPEQLEVLKQKVRVEIVAKTVPRHGFAMQTPQHVMITMVNHNHDNNNDINSD